MKRALAGVFAIVAGAFVGGTFGFAVRNDWRHPEEHTTLTSGDLDPALLVENPVPQDVLDFAAAYEDRFNRGQWDALAAMQCAEKRDANARPVERSPIFLPLPDSGADERTAVRAIDFHVSRFREDEDDFAMLDYYIDIELVEPYHGRHAFTGGELRVKHVDGEWEVCDDGH